MFPSRLLRMWPALVAVLLAPSAQLSWAAAQGGTTKIEIVADDMCCKGRAQKVAAQLYAAPGVTSVEAVIPNRLVVITAKPSEKLTLERLWQAVEKGKGGPSKLMTGRATYFLTSADKLNPRDRLPAGQYSVAMREMPDKDGARKIANQLYTVRDVKRVSVDIANRTLSVQSSNGALLSPWTLANAAGRTGNEPMAVYGPHGKLTIERAPNPTSATAARPAHPQVQGEVR